MTFYETKPMQTPGDIHNGIQQSNFTASIRKGTAMIRAMKSEFEPNPTHK